jgi:hypothetical protein
VCGDQFRRLVSASKATMARSRKSSAALSLERERSDLRRMHPAMHLWSDRQFGAIIHWRPWGRNPARTSAWVESRMGAVAWGPIGHRSVSHLRSSNRTCRFPASGFPAGFTARHATWPLGASVGGTERRVRGAEGVWTACQSPLYPRWPTYVAWQRNDAMGQWTCMGRLVSRPVSDYLISLFDPPNGHLLVPT